MLKAIDVQQVIIQMDQTAKVQHVLQQHPEMQQRYLEIQSREQQKLMKQTVRNMEEAKQTRIRDNEKREKRKNPVGHSDKEIVSHPEEMEQELPQQGEHINIKV
jgi:hypothetical protein